jgi:group I intron endonuclease
MVQLFHAAVVFLKLEMTVKSGIYSILQLSTALHYVGSAVELRRRWDRHKSDLNAGRHHNRKLQRSWNKYGSDDFRFDVLEACDESVLIDREQFWLDATLPFFNVLRQAYSMTGYKHSNEAKLKNSKAAKLMWDSMTSEQREKRVDAHAAKIKGSRHSEDTKRKMSESHKVIQMTERQLANLQRRNCPEAIAKRAALLAKNYVATSPSGEETQVENLTAFCKENDLNRSHMYAVAAGSRLKHKGWLCRHN